MKNSLFVILYQFRKHCDVYLYVRIQQLLFGCVFSISFAFRNIFSFQQDLVLSKKKERKIKGKKGVEKKTYRILTRLPTSRTHFTMPVSILKSLYQS